MTSNRVRNLRRDLDLTQAELANFLGLNVRTVRRWEDSSNAPTGGTLLILNTLEKGLSERAGVRIYTLINEAVAADLRFDSVLEKLLETGHGRE